MVLKTYCNYKKNIKKVKIIKRIRRTVIGAKGPYGNKPTNGFDSISEYKRWIFLKSLARNDKISNLRHHVRFTLKHGVYEADFVYKENNVTIVEDVKHPILLLGRKFIRNKARMLKEHGLKVFAIRPNLVRRPRELAMY